LRFLEGVSSALADGVVVAVVVVAAVDTLGRLTAADLVGVVGALLAGEVSKTCLWRWPSPSLKRMVPMVLRRRCCLLCCSLARRAESGVLASSLARSSCSFSRFSFSSR
jgi:hypothetical protein